VTDKVLPKTLSVCGYVCVVLSSPTESGIHRVQNFFAIFGCIAIRSTSGRCIEFVRPTRKGLFGMAGVRRTCRDVAASCGRTIPKYFAPSLGHSRFAPGLVARFSAAIDSGDEALTFAANRELAMAMTLPGRFLLVGAVQRRPLNIP
jgi:hypothetical protein